MKSSDTHASGELSVFIGLLGRREVEQEGLLSTESQIILDAAMI